MLKKAAILGMTLLLLLVFATTASAARQQFTHFSADIPDGWKVRDEGDTVEIVAPNRAAIMFVAVAEPGDVEAIGKAWAKKLQAEDGGMNEKGDFVFTFEKDGVFGIAVISNMDGYMLTLIVSGDIDVLEPVFASISK